jgi:hypothetical protein
MKQDLSRPQNAPYSSLLGARKTLTSKSDNASIARLDEAVEALDRLEFSAKELAKIGRHTTVAGLNLWQLSAASVLRTEGRSA